MLKKECYLSHTICKTEKIKLEQKNKALRKRFVLWKTKYGVTSSPHNNVRNRPLKSLVSKVITEMAYSQQNGNKETTTKCCVLPIALFKFSKIFFEHCCWCCLLKFWPSRSVKKFHSSHSTTTHYYYCCWEYACIHSTTCYECEMRCWIGLSDIDIRFEFCCFSFNFVMLFPCWRVLLHECFSSIGSNLL